MLGEQHSLAVSVSVEVSDNDGQPTLKFLGAATWVSKGVDMMDTILMCLVLLAIVIVGGNMLFHSFVRIAGLP